MPLDLLSKLGLKPSQHLEMVGWVLVVFVPLQLLIWLIIWLRMAGRRQTLKSVGRGMMAGGGASARLSQFDWMVWVRDRFWGPRRPDLTTDRAAALEELETRLHADGWMLLLERLLNFGPLLGVLLTTFGFVTLKLPSVDNAAAKDLVPLMMESLQPISLSMAAGVTIALVNLICQHFAEGSANGLRSAARNWLDQVVLPDVFESRKAADWNDPVLAMAGRLESVEQCFKQMSDDMKATFASLGTTLAQFATGMQATTLRLDLLPQRFDSMTTAATRLSEAALGLVGQGGGTIQRLDQLAGRIESLLTQRLDECTQSMIRVCTQLEATAGKLNGQATGLSESAQAVLVGSRSQVATFDQLQTLLSERLLPTHEKLDQSVTQLGEAMSKLTAPVGQLHSEVTNSVTSLARIVGSFEGLDTDFNLSIKEFRQSVSETLSPACEEHARQVRAHGASLKQLEGGLGDLNRGVESVVRIAAVHEQNRNVLVTATAGLSSSLSQADLVNRALQSAMDAQWQPLWTLMTRTVSEMQSAATKIESAVTGSLEPSMQSLGKLSVAVQRLVILLEPLQDLTDPKELVRAIDTLESTVADIRRPLVDAAKKKTK